MLEVAISFPNLRYFNKVQKGITVKWGGGGWKNPNKWVEGCKMTKNMLDNAMASCSKFI